jgi:uncharacterized membrane protein YqaE (UPF0057 family)
MPGLHGLQRGHHCSNLGGKCSVFFKTPPPIETKTMNVMLWVAAFFLPPLATLLTGGVRAAVVNALVWLAAGMLSFAPLMAVAEPSLRVLVPFSLLGPVAWLVSVIHAGVYVAWSGKVQRVREMNELRRIEGKHTFVSVEEKPGTILNTLIIGALAVLCAAGVITQRKINAEAERKKAVAFAEERRVIAEQQEAARERARLEQMTGWTFDEVQATYGAAVSTDKSTGWAQWTKFRARFEGGKVVEVTAR